MWTISGTRGRQTEIESQRRTFRTENSLTRSPIAATHRATTHSEYRPSVLKIFPDGKGTTGCHLRLKRRCGMVRLLRRIATFVYCGDTQRSEICSAHIVVTSSDTPGDYSHGVARNVQLASFICSVSSFTEFHPTFDKERSMFQYPGYFAYQMPSLARANLQAFLNMSGTFAGGLQALAELNVQTVRKMVEESNALLNAGNEASTGDVLGWQSIMLAQFPQRPLHMVSMSYRSCSPRKTTSLAKCVGNTNATASSSMTCRRPQPMTCRLPRSRRAHS